MTVKRLEIAGKPALLQETTYDVSSDGRGGNQPRGLGPDDGRRRPDADLLVAADEHTVLMGIGVSQERMAAALDVLRQPKKSLAEDADIAVTAAMLPADAQWVAYVSPRGYVQLVQRMMAAVMKHQPQSERPTLPDFARCPPVGVASRPRPPSCTPRSPFPRRWSRPPATTSRRCRR